MLDNIFIFSSPTRSGKTTALINFIFNTGLSVKGILSPDFGHKRVFFDIENRSSFDFETDASSAEKISVGRFHFLPDAFLKAQQIITDACETTRGSYDWLIIDEVGKLEITQNKGLASAVHRAVEVFKNGSAKGKLLLVVRDTLLQACIEKYGLSNAFTVNDSFFTQSIYHNILQNEKTMGLVMCGGLSSRMNTDKSVLNYHGKPQRYIMYDHLKSLVGNVLLSVNLMQSENIASGYHFVTDSLSFPHSGPMGGLLSAMEKFPGASFIVVGCDYPFVAAKHLTFFMGALSNVSRAACFFHPFNQMEEPLLAYYPHNSYESLKRQFNSGNYSLRKYLLDNRALKVIPWNADDIKSIDTQEDFEAAKLKLNLFLS